MKAEEAATALQSSEGSLTAVRSGELRKMKEENEELCERLAFLKREVKGGTCRMEEERELHQEALRETREELVC